MIISFQIVAANDGFTNVAGTQVMFIREPMTYADAEKNCGEKGAKLVEMWSLTEWKKITEWLERNLETNGTWYKSWDLSWVGLKSTSEEGTYV